MKLKKEIILIIGIFVFIIVLELVTNKITNENDMLIASNISNKKDGMGTINITIAANRYTATPTSAF